MKRLQCYAQVHLIITCEDNASWHWSTFEIPSLANLDEVLMHSNLPSVREVFSRQEQRIEQLSAMCFKSSQFKLSQVSSKFLNPETGELPEI